MKIVSQNDSELSLASEKKHLLSPHFMMPILFSVLLSSGGCLLGLSLLSKGSLFWETIIFLLGGGVSLAYTLKLNLSQDCVFDKQAGIATIKAKPLGNLGMSAITEFPLKNIVAVRLSSNAYGSTDIEIKRENEKPLMLTASENNNTEIAELLSRFIVTPLHIILGTETIIKFPSTWSTEAQVLPVSCPKCGGPLPVITHDMNYVTCKYCGTNMLVSWESKHVSFQTQELASNAG